MAKGFGTQAPDTVVTSIYNQIRKISRHKLKTNDDNLFVFSTSEKRKKAMSCAIHKVAQEFPELHFQVTYITEENPGTVIVKAKPHEKLFSYAWIEESELTNKWLVMGCPPGAWEYRCLSVWHDKQAAIDICAKIRDSVKSMPLEDWDKRKGMFQELLLSLPDDDDTIVGVMNLDTGEIKNSDPVAMQQIEKLIKLNRLNTTNPKDIACQIKEFLPGLENQ
jgi:hypothetical protein